MGGKNPFYVGEMYPSWLVSWGQSRSDVDVRTGFPDIPYEEGSDFLKWVSPKLRPEINFSLYMAVGGSNFHFSMGANGDSTAAVAWEPDMQSYDYESVINEGGLHTISKRPHYQNVDKFEKLKGAITGATGATTDGGFLQPSNVE